MLEAWLAPLLRAAERVGQVPFTLGDFFFWPFLLSTVVIAALVEGARRRHWFAGIGEFFRRDVWLHPSTRIDLGLFIIGAAIPPLAGYWVFLDDDGLVAVLRELMGWREPAGQPGLGWTLLFTLGYFVVYDFSSYLGHAAMHRIPALWQFHRVHHSAEVLTPLTSARFHLVDLAVESAINIAWLVAFVVLFGACTGVDAQGLAFLNLNVLLCATYFVDNLRHSPVWVSYGPRIGRWLISPAQHQLHHSREDRHLGERHLGCNLGQTLALWDRLAGTLYVPGLAPEQFNVGLAEPVHNPHSSIWRAYWEPLQRLLGRAPAP